MIKDLQSIGNEIKKYWIEFKKYECNWNIFKSDIVAMAEDDPDIIKEGIIFKLSEYYKIIKSTDHSIYIHFCGIPYLISFIFFKTRSVILHERHFNNETIVEKKKIIGEIWFDAEKDPNLYLLSPKHSAPKVSSYPPFCKGIKPDEGESSGNCLKVISTDVFSKIQQHQQSCIGLPS